MSPVANLPRVPLYMQVAANLCFVVSGILLTVLALKATEEAREIKERPRIAGLVADRSKSIRAQGGVPSVDHMFEG